MKFSQRFGALALVSAAFAQYVTFCPSNDGVCYAINIPASTASSGSGDIFFQISGPTTMSWIGLGQGTMMKGANIFMIYTNSEENNVTLSPRLGQGEVQPSADTSADVTLLAGSGISNNMMIANIKCSNCHSWSGGSMSFTDANSDWIWAYKSGSAISSNSISATLTQHTDYGTTTFNLQKAAGGSDTNPFSSIVATASTPSTSSPSPSKPSSSTSSSSSSSSSPSSGFSQGSDYSEKEYNVVRMLHAVLAPLAFAVFFPAGAILIRIFSFTNLIWFHAGWMIFTYMIVIATMGMGVWMAIVTRQLDTLHAHIGLVVVVALLLQPVTGLAHHLLYKRVGGPNKATYPHIWWGRAIVTLGIINGGLGLRLSGNTASGELAYGVVAGFMWLSWMVVIIVGFARSRSEELYEIKERSISRERITYPRPIEMEPVRPYRPNRPNRDDYPSRDQYR